MRKCELCGKPINDCTCVMETVFQNDFVNEDPELLEKEQWLAEEQQQQLERLDD